MQPCRGRQWRRAETAVIVDTGGDERVGELQQNRARPPEEDESLGVDAVREVRLGPEGPARQIALITVAPRPGNHAGASGGRSTLAKSRSTTCQASVNSTAPQTG